MKHKFTIWGRLASINEYNTAQRTNKYKGAQMKRNAQNIICIRIRDELKDLCINNPVIIKYAFFEPNKRRDHDNVSAFAHKVIQDALVECGTLKNDGWDYIYGFQDMFFLDKVHPRIEVILEEVVEDDKK